MNYRVNNFDFLRFLFASFVIITHSYPLSGNAENDFLYQITNGQTLFSYIGVKGFFVISGYLIFQSLQRSTGLLDYFWKRILRLYPALIIVLLLTIILAPFVYQSDIPFFLNKSLLTYIPNNLTLYYTQYAVEGIFENNPYKSAINGSLWTISYEFTMYLLLALLIFVRKNVVITKLILIGSFVLLLVCNLYFLEKIKNINFLLNGAQLVDLGIFFIAGALLESLNFKNLPRKKEFLILIILLVTASFIFHFFDYTKYITLPLLFILLGLNTLPYICDIGNKIGDLSYGIYIYGFPVQQTLMHYFNLNYISLMIYSLLISCILAYLSWHLVEKRALKLKKKIPLQGS